MSLVVFVAILATATVPAVRAAWRAAYGSAGPGDGFSVVDQGDEIECVAVAFAAAARLRPRVSDTFASPLRSAMTTGAILLGVATWSLLSVCVYRSGESPQIRRSPRTLK